MKLHRRMVIIALFLSGLLVVSQAVIASDPSSLERRLRAHVEFLSSDEMQGRLIGEAGDRLAELYLRTRFVEIGLEPIPGMDDYLQKFSVLRAEIDTNRTFLMVHDESGSYRFGYGGGILCTQRDCEEAHVEGDVAFAGYGITAPEYGYDDYHGLDVRGKIVLVFNHEPGERSDAEKFRGSRPTRYSNPVLKARMAAERGAVGLVIVSDAANHDQDIDTILRRRYGERLSKPSYCLDGEGGTVPIFYATKQVLQAILRGTTIDPLELQKAIDRDMRPHSKEISGKRVELKVGIERVKKLEVANVVGVLEGADARLSREYILIGAHHDHIGSGRDGIYNGADDNASGCSGLIEAARILSTFETGRSLLFVSFCGEEQGVLGSRYLADHIDTADVKLMINMDMIGRNNMDKEENADMFIVFTSAQTPLLEKEVRELADSLDVDVRVASYLQFRGASDHELFHRAGVPVVFYFSGFHRDYHGVGDVSGKIVPEKMRLIVEHLCRLVWKLSKVPDGVLLFDRSITEEPPKDHFEKPY